MNPSRSRTLLLAALTGWILNACGGTADATDAAAMVEGTDAQVMIDHLMTQTQTAREKIVGLAEAIPEESYDWRPGEGVRSVGEVFIHVAADNYLLPAIAGVAAPESTGILVEDYNTVLAYEGQDLTKAEILEALNASFDHLEAGVAASRSDLDATHNAFNSEFTGGGLWTMTVTHLHEHLGQSIAYARSNGVVPPWSR